MNSINTSTTDQLIDNIFARPPRQQAESIFELNTRARMANVTVFALIGMAFAEERPKEESYEVTASDLIYNAKRALGVGDLPPMPRGVTYSPGNPDPVCRLAAYAMDVEHYLGEDMREPEKCRDYVMMAANNPNVIRELPENGLGFWKSFVFHLEKHLAKKARASLQERNN
jgi:hypothetical protein